MTAREELAAVLHREMGCRRVPRVGSLRHAFYDYCERHPRSAGYGDWDTSTGTGICAAALALADALLASPAFARVIREREKAAWDEGAARVWEPLAAYAYNPDFYLDDNPYRDPIEEPT